MNKEQIKSLTRHLLSIIGGYLAMKGLTDSVTIETGSGVLMGLVSLYWSIREKSATADMISGAIRQTLSFAGGFLINFLNITMDEWQFWIGAIASLTPYIFKPGNIGSSN